MKKGETAYIVHKGLSGMLNTHLQYSVGLKEFHITNVGKIYAEGFILDRFGNLPNGGKGVMILTKKKKQKGKEIDFEQHDSVAIGMRLNMSQLLSFDDAKLELIKYIANDFSDESDRYIADESY